MATVLLEHANAAGDRWAAWIAAGLLDSVVLLALLALVWTAVRRSVAPQVGCYLFLLVPLKLLVPLEITVPASIARWTPSGLVSSWVGSAGGLVHRDEIDRVPASRPEVGVTRIAADASPSTLEPPPRSASEAADAHDLPQVLEAGTPRKTTATEGAPVPAAPFRHLRSPRLSASAVAMLFWLCGVLVLAATLAGRQLRFRRRLKRASPLHGAGLDADFHDFCRRAGVNQTVRFVESDDVGAPSLWGIFRPTVILPRGMAASLARSQLRWVVLHELAHVRRRDLLVIMLQRCAAVVHFFNPAVWIANRIVDRLREYACDDLAVALSGAPAMEGGEAFVEVLRYASHGRRRWDVALGVFGLDARASCFRRVRRMVDSTRPVRTRANRWALCGLILLAAVSLPHVRAAGDRRDSREPVAAAEPAARTETDAAPGSVETPAKNRQEFELLVVGPDGKPVAGATVEIRTRPIPSAEEIRRGEFLKKGSYGAFVKTDGDGRLAVELPAKPSRFNVSIETAGYGPYWAGWDSSSHWQLIPPSFTAELEAAWSVGGIVVNEQGNPIEGAEVHPSVNFKKRPGDVASLGIGTRLRTDTAGSWRFDSVPVSKGEVFVEMSHPDFMPNRRSLTRSEFGIEPEQKPAAKIVLQRGLTVTGKVTDEAGTPIAGALVRTKFLNDIRSATTGDDGVYGLVGCDPRMAKIVVSAEGRATDMKEVRIDPGMEPVDFRMQPGGRIRIRVLDEQGNPVPRARIFFQRWRGPFDYFEFDHVDQYADEKGVWEWNEAPLDEFKADICRPDGMQLAKQSLVARAEEYVFRLPPALVISGTVVDAETKEPIGEFRVVPGVRSSESHMNWVRGESFTATGGKYRIRHTHDYFAHLVRIEAAGYQAAVSRDVKSNEGDVRIDFELNRGKDVAATVLTPAGHPAAGAKIALGVAGSQIRVENGAIDDGSTYAARLDADDSGRFRFPPQDAPFELVVTHASGFAYVKAAPESAPATIQLTAWARVEGTFRVGRQPVSSAPITINVGTVHSYGDDVPKIFTHHDVTTGPGGRFVFERVFAGNGRIGRRIMLTVDDGATEVTSSRNVAVSLEAGQTTHIDLGGTGRPVVGRLEPPQGFQGKALWNFALVNVEVDLPRPKWPEIPADAQQADPEKRRAWWEAWQQTEEGKAWKAAYDEYNRLRSESPYFTASVDRDGTFRISDVPAGDYVLRVRFDQHVAGRLSEHRFSVPPIEGTWSDEPLDLGTLTLEPM